MKNFFKRWLGPPDIDGLNARISALENRQVVAESDKRLRILIGNALAALISGKEEDLASFDWYEPYKVRTEFESSLNLAVKSRWDGEIARATYAVTQTLNETVNSEKFIDEIVARIQRKQL